MQIKKLASLGVKKASSKGITNSHVEEMPPWPLKAWLKRQGVVMGIWEVPGSIPNVKKKIVTSEQKGKKKRKEKTSKQTNKPKN